MAITPSLKELYEQRRFENHLLTQERKAATYREFPELKRLDLAIKSTTVSIGQNKILGHNSAIEELLQQKQLYMKQKEDFLNFHHISKDYAKDIVTCPICNDQGSVNGAPCSCYMQMKADILFAHSPIRHQMEKENFKTFNLSYYSDEVKPPYPISPRENMRTVYDICKQFVASFPSGNNLLFQGSTGVGKTFLSNCIAKELMQSCYTVTYLSSHQFFDILSGYQFHRKEMEQEEEEQYQYIYDTDLLIIDDLGTEVMNAFVDSSLFECINKRYMLEKSTIISTNLTTNQLEQAYSRRITSRLLEHYHQIPVFGTDIRLKKGLNH